MKFSDAVIKSYTDPELPRAQIRGAYIQLATGVMTNWYEGAKPKQVIGCCVAGACAIGGSDLKKFENEFDAAVGVKIMSLNDEGMDWRDIVGIAIAEGL